MHDEFTEDAALNGRVRLRQPKRGHRFGHDAILLAAACPARAGEYAIELGAGVGAAGLALAVRVPSLKVILVEREAALCELARQNIALNKLEDRVTVHEADVATLGLAPSDHVLMNPPFNDPARAQASPDPSRRSAHVGGADVLARWAAAAAGVLKPNGTLALIWRADGLDAVRRALAPSFGALGILPIQPKPGAEPIRVLVRAQKGAARSERRYGPLVLNDAENKPSPAAEAVLRAGESLALAETLGSGSKEGGG